MMKKYLKQLLCLVLALVLTCSVLSPALPEARAQAVTGTADDFGAVISDDFEDFDTSKTYWTAQTVTPVTEGGNTYASITGNGPAVSSYFSPYLRPTKMSFSAKGAGEAGLFLAIPDASGTTVYKGLWNYNFFSIQGTGHGLWGYGAVQANGTGSDARRIFNDSKNNCATTDSKYLVFKMGEWFHVEASFDYSAWETDRAVSVTYTVTGKIHGILVNDAWVYDDPGAVYEKGGTEYHIGDRFTMDAVTYRFLFTGADYDAPVTFAIGNPGTRTTTLCIDDYRAEYDTAHGAVSAFVDAHRAALEGTDTGASALEAAANAYFALSAQAQSTVDANFAEGVGRLTAYLAANPDTEATSYQVSYGQTLALTEGNVRPADQEAVTAAMEAYADLSQKAKLTLKTEYNHLLALQTAIDYYVTPREDNDFSPWVEDFECGNLKNWVLSYDHSGNDKDYNWYVDAEVVPDPDDPENRVLKVQQSGGYRLQINDDTWPPLGSMQTLSFRFKGMPGLNNSYRHKLYTWYIDEENYAYICISNEVSTYLVTVIDGQSKEEAKTIPEALDIQNWMDINIVYNQAKSNYSATITDSKGKSIIWGGNLKNASGRFIIGQQKNAMFGDGHYVDDIVITMAEGDWDIDKTVSELEVYYDANVWMAPGDIVTVSGENLGALTQKVQLIRLEDTADYSQVFYPGQQTYKYNPDADTDPLKKSMTDLLALYTFTEDDTVQIAQRTVDSVKFRIPATLEPGIYAVKLTNASAGEDTVVFINRPHMSFVWGEDGSSTALGSQLRVIVRKMMLSTDAGDMSKVRIALVDPTTHKTVYQAAPERADDIYSAYITLPDNIAVGSYEVYVHNGFGDNNMWSEAGTVTITAQELRATWDQTVFNVVDYGAVSDVEVNSTPAFVAALEAAAQNGGGIVYVPTGTYALVHTLVIPQNVSFRGDGIQHTHLLYDVDRWDLGDARALLIGEANLEICGMTINAPRHKEIFLSAGTKDHYAANTNIYIHDIRVKALGMTETITNGSGNVGYDKRYSVDEIIVMLREEISGNRTNGTANFDFGEGRNNSYRDAANIQMYHCSFYFDEAKKSNLIKIGGTYNYLSNLTVVQGSGGWCSGLTYDYGIMEYCDLGSNATVGLQGNNWYFGHNDMHDTTTNNREAYTTDGGFTYSELTLQKDETDPTGCTYNIIGITITDQSKKMLIVRSGQGFSQARRIVSNTESTIKVDQPFAVEPNRNSVCGIHNMRTDNIFTENRLSNIGVMGSYGTMVDYVFDSNTFTSSKGYSMDIWTQNIWGVSMVDSSIEDAWVLHGTGSIASSLDESVYYGVSLRVQGADYSGAMAHMLVRNIEFREGANLLITLSSMGESLKDVVIQGNSFEGYSGITPINMVGSLLDMSKAVDGILLADNTYTDADVRYSSGFVASYQAGSVNKAGDARIRFLDEEYRQTPAGVRGDVNADGSFDAEDISYVRDYLAGKVTVAAAELKAFTQKADITGDGIVDLRDVNLMEKALEVGWENVEMPSVTPVTYRVTFVNGGQPVDSRDYDPADQYGTFPSVSKPGYSLKGWYLNPEGTGTALTPSTAVKQGDHSVYAVWTENTPEPDPEPGDGLGGSIVPDEDVFE